MTKVSDLPWEVDRIRNRETGDYFALRDAKGRIIADTLNSDVVEIVTEHDEDCCSIWDVQGAEDLEQIAKAMNAFHASGFSPEDLPELARMIPDLSSVMSHNPLNQVYFRAGLLACREYMARFVEQGGDATTAASIRANWWPSLGKDPGAPRRLSWDECAVENPDGTITHADTDPSVEALPRALQFLQSRGP